MNALCQRLTVDSEQALQRKLKKWDLLKYQLQNAPDRKGQQIVADTNQNSLSDVEEGTVLPSFGDQFDADEPPLASRKSLIDTSSNQGSISLQNIDLLEIGPSTVAATGERSQEHSTDVNYRFITMSNRNGVRITIDQDAFESILQSISQNYYHIVDWYARGVTEGKFAYVDEGDKSELLGAAYRTLGNRPTSFYIFFTLMYRHSLLPEPQLTRICRLLIKCLLLMVDPIPCQATEEICSTIIDTLDNIGGRVAASECRDVSLALLLCYYHTRSVPHLNCDGFFQASSRRFSSNRDLASVMMELGLHYDDYASLMKKSTHCQLCSNITKEFRLSTRHAESTLDWVFPRLGSSLEAACTLESFKDIDTEVPLGRALFLFFLPVIVTDSAGLGRSISSLQSFRLKRNESWYWDPCSSLAFVCQGIASGMLQKLENFYYTAQTVFSSRKFLSEYCGIPNDGELSSGTMQAASDGNENGESLAYNNFPETQPKASRLGFEAVAVAKFTNWERYSPHGLRRDLNAVLRQYLVLARASLQSRSITEIERDTDNFLKDFGLLPTLPEPESAPESEQSHSIPQALLGVNEFTWEDKHTEEHLYVVEPEEDTVEQQILVLDPPLCPSLCSSRSNGYQSFRKIWTKQRRQQGISSFSLREVGPQTQNDHKSVGTPSIIDSLRSMSIDEAEVFDYMQDASRHKSSRMPRIQEMDIVGLGLKE